MGASGDASWPAAAQPLEEVGVHASPPRVETERAGTGGADTSRAPDGPQVTASGCPHRPRPGGSGLGDGPNQTPGALSAS